jgi:uncharacterized protein YjiS (DUF1127 family)
VQRDEIERRARNALATMRLAYAAPGAEPSTGVNVATIATSRDALPSSVTQRMQAAVDAIAGFTGRFLARRQRRLKARAICEALRACDDRMLRDLGMHRSEIMSLAAEAVGTAPCTRERIHRLRRAPR